MREGNYKISRLNIFCIIMMTVAIVLFKFMIVQAADSNAIESVKVGKVKVALLFKVPRSLNIL